MSTAMFCDTCGNPYPEFQIGSARISVEAYYGKSPEKRQLDVCKNCNPFLKNKVAELEARKALLEEKIDDETFRSDNTAAVSGYSQGYEWYPVDSES